MQQSSGALAPVKSFIVLFAAAQAFLQYLAWADGEEPDTLSMTSAIFHMPIQLLYHLYWIGKLNEGDNDVLKVRAACVVFGCVLVVSLVVISENNYDKPDGLVLASYGLDALMAVINCSIAFKHGDKIQAPQWVTGATVLLLILSSLSQLDREHSSFPIIMQLIVSVFQSISGTYACHAIYKSSNFDTLLRSFSFTAAVAAGTFAQLSHEGLLESDEQAMDLLWLLHIMHATVFGMVHMVWVSHYIDEISPTNFIDTHKDKLIAPLTALSFGYAVIKNQEPSIFVVKNALCAFLANAALNFWALKKFEIKDFLRRNNCGKAICAWLGLLSAGPFVPILTDFKGHASDITNDSWAFILAIVTSMFITYAHTLSIGKIKETLTYFKNRGYKISVPALFIALGASLPYLWDLFDFTIDFAGMVGGIAAGLICTGPFLAFICVAVKALVEFLGQQCNTFNSQSWRQTMGLLYICSGAATTALQSLDNTPFDHPALKMLFLALNAAVNVVGFKGLITSKNKTGDKIISFLLGVSLLFSTIYTKTQMDADTLYKVSGVVLDAAFSISLILNYHTSGSDLKKVSLGVGFISFMVSCGLLEGMAVGENNFDQALLLARRLPFMFAGNMGLVRQTEKVYTEKDIGKQCKLALGYVLFAAIGGVASPVLIGDEDFNTRILSALVVSSASSRVVKKLASTSNCFQDLYDFLRSKAILFWIACFSFCLFAVFELEGDDVATHEKVFGALALSLVVPMLYDYFKPSQPVRGIPVSQRQLCENINSSSEGAGHSKSSLGRLSPSVHSINSLP